MSSSSKIQLSISSVLVSERIDPIGTSNVVLGRVGEGRRVVGTVHVVGHHMLVHVVAPLRQPLAHQRARALWLMGEHQGPWRSVHRSNHTWAWPVPDTDSYWPNCVPRAVQAAPPSAPTMIR